MEGAERIRVIVFLPSFPKPSAAPSVLATVSERFPVLIGCSRSAANAFPDLGRRL
jgi:hypothetical protein